MRGNGEWQVAVGPEDLVVDNTILKSMATCPTQVAMRHVLGLVTKEEGMDARAGAAIHVGLARWLVTHGDVGSSLAAFNQDYQEWAKANVPADHRLAWRPLHDLLELWVRGHTIEKLPWVVDPATVELAASAELVADDAGRIVMVALLDALGKKRTGGGTWPVDHKTTHRISDWWKDRQRVAAQFSGQVWILKQHGMLAGGVFVNAMETAKLPDSTRRCGKHGRPFTECGPSHFNHEIILVTRSVPELAAWERQARKLAKQFRRLKAKVRDVHDVRELDMRGRFNEGCTFCGYQAWCWAGRPASGVVEFQESPWDPLELSRKRGGVLDKVAAAGVGGRSRKGGGR